jgi:hypothetical protein
VRNDNVMIIIYITIFIIDTRVRMRVNFSYCCFLKSFISFFRLLTDATGLIYCLTSNMKFLRERERKILINFSTDPR